jgi:hypothetical protein
MSLELSDFNQRGPFFIEPYFNGHDTSALIDLLKKQEDEKKLKIEKEQLRLDNISCPACKSKEKHFHNKYDSNGVYGSGYKSWLIESYIICMNCGVMYVDLEKLKNKNI